MFPAILASLPLVAVVAASRWPRNSSRIPARRLVAEVMAPPVADWSDDDVEDAFMGIVGALDWTVR